MTFSVPEITGLLHTYRVPVTLNLRQALSRSSAALRRFPVLLCLPLVLCNLGTSLGELFAHRFLGKNAGLVVGLFVLLVCFVATYFAELIVSTLFLSTEEGLQPTRARATQAVGYDGAWVVLRGLVWRYFAWGAAVVLVMMVIALISVVIGLLVHGAAKHASGISAAAGGISATTLWKWF